MTRVLWGKPNSACARALLSLVSSFAAMLLFVCAARAQTPEPCTPAFGQVVSIQGTVQLSRAGGGWQTVQPNAMLCGGDKVWVHPRSRAALRLSNETTLRLDQSTTLTLAPTGDGKRTLLEDVKGGLHIISRTPKPYNVTTPFLNASVEGTEFLVRVTDDMGRIAVYEGRVNAWNNVRPIDRPIELASGEEAVATSPNVEPTEGIIVRPKDAVAWTVYFPTVFDSRLDAGDAGSPVHRAGMLLLVGRIDEAKPLLDQVVRDQPDNSDAHALLSIIAVVQNDKEQGLQLGERAVALDPRSAAVLIALSYAQQALFRIEQAQETVRAAVALNPANALAWARLAELEMSMGHLDLALGAASRAVTLDPNLARTHTVLGFAHLTTIDPAAAKLSFTEAIRLDQADPLPRLGMGLAKIRDGDLAGGRVDIEIAAILDPQNSLVRSYLGKAYFEEKRSDLSAGQLELARTLDLRDPTPRLYDAILKQSINRPVEALDALQDSIALNGDRAVYRSWLLLDQDHASRNAALGRIYADAGFAGLALAAGAASIADDPTNASAHRLLADSYVDLPRHEIARVSELLQSQLRQPLSSTPTQLQLADDKFVALRGAGPSAAGLNEFNALFSREGTYVQGSIVAGGNDTAGDQLLVSGIHGTWGYGLGHLAYHTDGFHENNDFRKTIYDIFAQYQHDPSLSVQAEIRRSESSFGDTVLRFDPLLFFPDRNRISSNSYRIGGNYVFAPHSTVVASAIAVDSDVSNAQFGSTMFEQHVRTRIAEVQHVWKDKHFDVISGAGTYFEDTRTVFLGAGFEARPRARNVYAYGNVRPPGARLRLHLGVSLDRVEAGDELGGSKRQTSPKLGLTWSPSPRTTLRVAHFRTLKRRFFASQTLEPTQVAGFNQFFDDFNGTDARRTGVALDHRLADRLYAGVESSKRKLRVPQDFTNNEVFNWSERQTAAYIHWAPHTKITLSARYINERFGRTPDFPGQELFVSVATKRTPLQLDFRHPGGFSMRLTATHVRQDGLFYSSSGNPDAEPGSDRFWVTDFSMSCRLPRRFGAVTLEVKNLFDRTFRYQETDISTSSFARQRMLFARATFNF